MSCSSAIYTSSQNVDVAPNGVIPFGSINRRFGCNCQLSGNDIVCSGRGYYLVSVTASVTPDAAGLIGIQLYADGAPVPGADAYATGTADATVPLSITPVLVRVRCDAAKSLSVRLVSGDATTGAVVMSTHATVAKV